MNLNLPALRIGELSDRNASFALVADIDQNLVVVHGDDDAVYDLSFFQGLKGRLHELLHRELIGPLFVFLISVHLRVYVQVCSFSLATPQSASRLSGSVTLRIPIATVKPSRDLSFNLLEQPPNDLVKRHACGVHHHRSARHL